MNSNYVAETFPLRHVAEAFPLRHVAEAFPLRHVAKASPLRHVAEAFLPRHVAEAFLLRRIARHFVAVLLLAGSLSAQKTAGPSVIVVTDPDRGALVRWPLPEGAYPAGGFELDRIVDGSRQMVTIVKPGMTPGIGALSPEKARFATKYIQLASNPGSATDEKLKNEFTQTRLVVQLMSLADPLFAQALAIAVTDSAAPRSGTLTYEVLALDANGRPSGTYAISTPAPFVSMPPPAPPADLRGVAEREGVGLLWSAPSKEERNPAAAVSYELRRSSSVLTPEPVLKLVSSAETEEAPGFVDHQPVVESANSYTIVAIDIFGRRGPESAPVEVFFPDFTALDPPADIAESTSEGKAILSWTAPANRNRKGWRIVRALQPEAVGEPVKDIVSASQLVDSSVVVGTTYYYRISAVNQRGDEGLPGTSQAVLVRSGKAPASPGGLTAQVKTGKIILSWEPGPESVAGYQVERSADGSKWSLMNRTVSAEPRYDDVYPRDASGSLRYRVVAWSYDDTPSLPSAVLSVPLPDTNPPLAPLVESIDGGDGKVTIQFAPGGSRDEVARFYVLRSPVPRDAGVILNAEGLAPAERTFVDPAVESGVTYFYRLVAVDAAGNRSTPSDPPAAVTVAAPPLPAPPLPKARLETTPFPRIVFDFAASQGPSVRYALERKDPNGRWVMIQGPFAQEATSAMDANPPKSGRAVYRLVTMSSNGATGPRSAEVEVVLEKK